MNSRSHIHIASALLVLLYVTSSCTTGLDSQQSDAGGFWYGTQSLSCIADGETGRKSGLSISRRSINPGSLPSRADGRYIHRLLYYRRWVFEWGSGALAYHVGRNASVTSCPVSWEQHPAGTSNCSVDSLIDWSMNYERTYGGYNVLVNNCHQFANRAVAFLLTCPGNTGRTSPLEASHLRQSVDDRVDYGGPSAVMNSVWKFVQWLSSVLHQSEP